jgi:hypothetical protein
MTTLDSKEAALADIRAGRCPDGGGPHCVCRLLDKPHQCTSLARFRTCQTCDADGVFRIGTFADHCGDCLGTKIVDTDVLAAVLESERIR